MVDPATEPEERCSLTLLEEVLEPDGATIDPGTDLVETCLIFDEGDETGGSDDGGTTGPGQTTSGPGQTTSGPGQTTSGPGETAGPEQTSCGGSSTSGG